MRLGRGEIERIAFEGARVELNPAALARVAASRRATLDALAGAGSIYGVNTGQGFLAGRALTEGEAARHQRDLLLGRAVGSAPWLAPEASRAVLAVRLARFLDGRAGVSAGLCAFIADRLDDGFTPAIPRTSIGCAGEVIRLSHAFQTLTGVGRVLEGGGLRDAASALAARGVAPYQPEAKEGIALLAGSPATTALALARRRAGARLGRLLELRAACAIDAARAPLDPCGAGVGRLTGDPLLGAVLERLGGLLEGSDPQRRPSQAPVSFRVAPQVLTHLERAPASSRPNASTGCSNSRVTGLPDQLTPAPGSRCGLVVLHKRAAGAAAELRRLAAPASVGIGDTSLGQEDALDRPLGPDVDAVLSLLRELPGRWRRRRCAASGGGRHRRSPPR